MRFVCHVIQPIRLARWFYLGNRSILSSRLCGLFTTVLAFVLVTSLGAYTLISGSSSLVVVGALFAGLFWLLMQ